MRSKFIGVRLPEALLARVDQHAAELGEARSLAIRSLLRRALAEEQRRPESGTAAHVSQATGAT